MNLKAAVVGCGAIADGHVEQIQKLGASVVAVCDRERLMAEQLAVRFGIPGIYNDYERMLSETTPDVVHITTPPQSHLELAVKALDAGCHAYVEKPVTVTGAEAERLIAHARHTRRKITVGHIYQFDPPALALRRMAAAGVFGDITHVESHFGYNLSGTFGKAIMSNPHHWVHTLPGNIPQNNISHAVSKVVEYLSADDITVQATGWRPQGPEYGDSRDDLIGELRVLLRAGDRSGYVTFSTRTRPIIHAARVYGTRNSAHANFVARTVTLERAPRLPTVFGRILPAFGHSWAHFREGGRNLYRFARADFHFLSGMHELIRRFYRAIIDDADVPIPYDEILGVSRVMDDVFAQVDGATGFQREGSV